MTLTFFVLGAVPLYRELSRRSDIWWTPRATLVPLAQSSDRVEIYARGRPLVALLEAGQIRIAQEAGASVLTAADVGLRFNNFDHVRAAELPMLLAAAAGCGVAVLMFLLLVTGRLAYRPERGESA
jgi:predicted xylose isomerase-like sugar epimerase